MVTGGTDGTGQSPLRSLVLILLDTGKNQCGTKDIFKDLEQGNYQFFSFRFFLVFSYDFFLNGTAFWLI